MRLGHYGLFLGNGFLRHKLRRLHGGRLDGLLSRRAVQQTHRATALGGVQHDPRLVEALQHRQHIVVPGVLQGQQAPAVLAVHQAHALNVGHRKAQARRHVADPHALRAAEVIRIVRLRRVPGGLRHVLLLRLLLRHRDHQPLVDQPQGVHAPVEGVQRHPGVGKGPQRLELVIALLGHHAHGVAQLHGIVGIAQHRHGLHVRHADGHGKRAQHLAQGHAVRVRHVIGRQHLRRLLRVILRLADLLHHGVHVFGIYLIFHERRREAAHQQIQRQQQAQKPPGKPPVQPDAPPSTHRHITLFHSIPHSPAQGRKHIYSIHSLGAHSRPKL